MGRMPYFDKLWGYFGQRKEGMLEHEGKGSKSLRRKRLRDDLEVVWSGDRLIFPAKLMIK